MEPAVSSQFFCIYVFLIFLSLPIYLHISDIFRCFENLEACQLYIISIRYIYFNIFYVFIYFVYFYIDIY